MKYFLLLGLVILFAFPTIAMGHTLENESTIGAVLHISPEDDPIAGEISTLFFEITDITDRFQTGLCECTVTIEENGTVISTIPVYPDESAQDQTNATLIYTFPKISVYKVTLSGKPISGDGFDEFSLSYDVRVAREIEEKNPDPVQTDSTQTEQTFSSGLLLFLGIGAATGVIAGIIYFLRKKHTS